MHRHMTSLVKENNFASISTASTYTVGVINSEHDLSVTGQTRILDSPYFVIDLVNATYFLSPQH